MKHELLRWARESAGFSLEEASRKIGISRKTLQQWETLGGYPTVRQLDEIGEKYKRPTAALFLPEPPREPTVPTDFRRFPSQALRQLRPSTRLSLRKARWLQRSYIDLLHALGGNGRKLAPEKLLAPTTGFRGQPNVLADEARHALGVSLEDQAKWKRAELALRNWKHALERQHVLVFQFHIDPSDQVRGFCLAGEVSVIALSAGDTAAGRVFTLFHEWAHILLARPGVCAPEETRVAGSRQIEPEDSRVENFCNAFSGSFLVPKAALLRSVQTFGQRALETELEAVVEKCSQEFAVSRFVVLRRLCDEERVDRRVYWSLVRQWKQLTRQPKSGGFLTPPQRTISELGPTYVGSVIGALDKGILSCSEAVDYLSIRLKHLDTLRELVSGESHV